MTVITPQNYYARQMRLPEIGQAGQDKLSAAKILIVGVGGLGSAAAACLAAAGIGTLVLADADRLDASNLHRQMIYSASDIGKPKVILAAERLRALNPLIKIETVEARLDAANVAEMLARCDLVLDCTDNFTTKYLLNDVAILFQKPLFQASIYRFDGQLLTIDSTNAAGCLRCLFPAPPPEGMVGDCAEIGVLGTLPALFGTLQANEAIKYILGLGVSTDLFLFDLLSLKSQNIQRERNTDCKTCAGKISMGDIMQKNDLDFTAGANANVPDLAKQFYLIDVRETPELLAVPLPGALHLPTSDFDVTQLTEPKDKPILVICAKGARSHQAAKYLRSQGWEQAYSLVGGITSLAL